MSDACNGPFLLCGDETVSVTTSTNTNCEFEHTINNSLVGTFESISVDFLKTNRTYKASWSSDYKANVNRAIRTYPNFESVGICGSPNTTFFGTTCEDCSITTNKILYYDPFQKILFLEENVQVLKFNVTSSEIATMREKWGTGIYLKIKIKNAKVTGVQKYRLISTTDNLDSILHTCEYSFDPFPESTGMATWGLYGNQVEKNATNYEPNVQMILLYPQPASLGIPLNSGGIHGGDVLHYGFYDYNAKEGGFIETDLPKLDGGKDMFYPMWCRNMQTDPVWRAEADRRYSVRWEQGSLANSDYTARVPDYSLISHGQMITHELKGGFYSFTVIDRNGVVKTFNGIRAPEKTIYEQPTVPFVTKLHTNYSSLGFL